MGVLEKLKQWLSAPPASQEAAYWLYVQCDRCGEKIRSRVDLYNDLSAIYDASGTSYFCRKILMGQQRCYQKIEVEMWFDARRRLTERKISGGQFISADAFAQNEG
jgi:hypothetical protein